MSPHIKGGQTMKSGNEKKQYETASVRIVPFTMEDIITASDVINLPDDDINMDDEGNSGVPLPVDPFN